MNQKIWNQLTAIQRFNYLDIRWHKQDEARNAKIQKHNQQVRASIHKPLNNGRKVVIYK